MAEALTEKQVLFCGIWRPRQFLDDAFLRLVSQQFQEKPGAQATWRLTREGLTLIVTQSESGRQGRMDQIPVHSIKQVTVNRYNPLCLMALYLDPVRRFNALVCRCHSEQDAATIVQVFGQLKKSTSGEGYKIDLKQPRGINWTLKNKAGGEDEEEDGEGGGMNGFSSSNISSNGSVHSREEAGLSYVNNNNLGEVTVEREEEVLEREALDVEGKPCFNVGVQAGMDPYDDMDRDSIASDRSYQSLKEELDSLTNEVHEIKLLLEQTTGISAEEFFRRQRESGVPTLVPVKRMLSHESDSAESGSGEKRVNFAGLPADEEMEFDIRSIGMQTPDQGPRVRYQKRIRNVLTPSRFQQTGRVRNGSTNSASSPTSYQSPTSSMHAPVFVFGNRRYIDPRQDMRYGVTSLSRPPIHSSGGTVVRPIESVYHVHTQGSRQKRRQIVVLPTRANSMPRSAVYRTGSSGSAAGSANRGLSVGGGSLNVNPAVDMAQNGQL